MKHRLMAQPPEKPPSVVSRKPRKTGAAFDLWLQRGLHQLFDDVTREPIPEELLRVIEEDREERQK